MIPILLTLSILMLFNTNYEMAACINETSMTTTVTYTGNATSVSFPPCEETLIEYHTHTNGMNYASKADYKRWELVKNEVFIIQYDKDKYVEYVRLQ